MPQSAWLSPASRSSTSSPPPRKLLPDPSSHWKSPEKTFCVGCWSNTDDSTTANSFPFLKLTQSIRPSIFFSPKTQLKIIAQNHLSIMYALNWSLSKLAASLRIQLWWGAETRHKPKEWKSPAEVLSLETSWDWLQMRRKSPAGVQSLESSLH